MTMGMRQWMTWRMGPRLEWHVACQLGPGTLDLRDDKDDEVPRTGARDADASRSPGMFFYIVYLGTNHQQWTSAYLIFYTVIPSVLKKNMLFLFFLNLLVFCHQIFSCLFVCLMQVNNKWKNKQKKGKKNEIHDRALLATSSISLDHILLKFT